MKHRLVALAAVLSLCGAAAAQNNTRPVKKEPAPGKNTEPLTPIKAPEAQPEAPKESQGTLKVGAPAPEISADTWVKGAEVKAFEKGKVYVMEFWATWCPPCRESIPHLTKLKKAHKDLTIIGMASSERAPKQGQQDRRLPELQNFVRAQGPKMEYTVAYDSKRAMGEKWLRAAGVNTIPTAFVVGADTRIAWIGNPLDDGFEKAVTAALSIAKKTEPNKEGEKPKKPDGPRKKGG
ncbi:Sporulation thiol-disulfide oxidoreductase A [Phycisphaerales bacterium]|nr:Sporulation thiol-disulfide oxidoreductase A [Phycisphaerales bacterium]